MAKRTKKPTGKLRIKGLTPQQVKDLQEGKKPKKGTLRINTRKKRR